MRKLYFKYFKILHLIIFFVFLAHGSPAFAEPPPYGPSADPWGGCVDMDTNGTGGLVTVICPTLSPSGGISRGFIENAQKSCLSQPNSTFGEIKGKYICMFVQNKPSNRKQDTLQFTAADWKQFQRIAGRVHGRGECPPNHCNDWRVTTESQKPTPTTSLAPSIAIAAARPQPASAIVVDVNTASQQALAAIPSIGPQTAQVIVDERSKGPFKGAMDMAARMCQTNSVDFGSDSVVKIQGETYAPRGGNPAVPGFICIAGSNAVALSGRTLPYVGHVTLLR